MKQSANAPKAAPPDSAHCLVQTVAEAFTEEPKVEVERKETRPRPAREDRKGLFRWEFALDPGREEKIAFSYTVKLPADRQLVAATDATVKW